MMRSFRMLRVAAGCALVAATIAFMPALGAHGAEAPSTAARRILRETGVRGGLVVHLGCGDGKLTSALHAGEGFLVHGLGRDAAEVERAQATIRAAGAYGDVSVDTFDGRRLPYADNLVNLLVAEDLGDVTMAETLRVLAPNGVAYLKRDGQWTKTVKPWPDDMDEWTHYLHGADANAVAEDTVVGPPRRMQWIGGPLFIKGHDTTPGVSALVSSGGRIFYIVDEAPKSVLDVSMPDKWFLVARDAFNGVVLWKKPIEDWGWRAWRYHWFQLRGSPEILPRRLVALDGKVYVTLGFNAPVTALDAATGDEIRTYEGTEHTSEIVYHNGVLVLSVNEGPIPKKHYLQYVRNRIKIPDMRIEGSDEVPATPKKIVAVDAETGRLLWERKGYQGIAFRGPGSSSLALAANDRHVCFMDEDEKAARLVSLDFKTGKDRWTAEIERKRRPGYYPLRGRVGEPILVDDAVVVSMVDGIVCLAADTGQMVWEKPKGSTNYNQARYNAFVIDGLVWVQGTEEGIWVEPPSKKRKNEKDEYPFPLYYVGYDVKSGEEREKVSLGTLWKVGHHHRCYRNKATSRYILTARRGAEFVDLTGGEHSLNYWIRGACAYGVMPCNGLLYAPPRSCSCSPSAQVHGFCALAPAKGREEDNLDTEPASRVDRGPAYGDAATLKKATSADKNDWPTYRHDAGRSCSTNDSLPPNLREMWSAEIAGKLSSPTVAGGRAFVSSVDSHTIWALDARDGTKLWSFTAGGRVDSPPSIHKGMAVFGSADGRVYCLRASDGVLRWRFRAAPEDVRIGSFGQLESAWPVHGSVLVKDDVAYFAAGRSSFLDGGIYLFGLDVFTGKPLHQTVLTDLDLPWDKDPEGPGNPRLATGALSDILLADPDGFLCMRSTTFDSRLERQTRRNTFLEADSGFLDESYFKRYPWQGLRSVGQLIVSDGSKAYYVKMTESRQMLELRKDNVFSPGKEGYILGAISQRGRKGNWTVRVPVRVQAMLVAGETLFIAGPPDVLDPDDPFGAFEGRKGGLLWAVSATDGAKLAECQLEAPPTFNGMAAAGGSLYVSTTGGKLLCFAGK